MGELRLQEKKTGVSIKEAGVRDAVFLTWRSPLLSGGFGLWVGVNAFSVWVVSVLEKPGLLAVDCTTGVAQERDKKDVSRKQDSKITRRPSGLSLLPPSFPPVPPATGGQGRVCLCCLETHAGFPGHMARACAACSISTTTTRS